MMIEKRMKLTVDVKFKIDDITKDNVNRDLKDFANYGEIIQDPMRWEMAERQKRFFDVLLQNEEVLNEILTKLLIERLVEPTSSGKFHTLFGVEKDEEEILEPVLSALSREDAEFFREAIDEGVFFENTEHIWNRFQEEVKDASIDIF
jgi:hypothetical protein